MGKQSEKEYCMYVCVCVCICVCVCVYIYMIDNAVHLKLTHHSKSTIL